MPVSPWHAKAWSHSTKARSTVQIDEDGTLWRSLARLHWEAGTPSARSAISVHARPQSQLNDCRTCGTCSPARANEPPRPIEAKSRPRPSLSLSSLLTLSPSLHDSLLKFS
eukprot:scaffold164889_cov41-Tisochrysis_lutea.AAC.1